MVMRRCPQISIDPYLQKGIQNKIVKSSIKLDHNFHFTSRWKFRSSNPNHKSAGIVLGVTLRSTSEYQVVRGETWNWEKSHESMDQR